MTTALYVRKGFEHRAPVTEEAFIEAWTLVCGIDQWQALEEFQEAVAYGDIYEVQKVESFPLYVTVREATPIEIGHLNFSTVWDKYPDISEIKVLDSHSWYVSNTGDAPSTHFFQTTGAQDVSYY